MSENPEEVEALIDRVLDSATLSVQELADATGISPHTLWAWAAGRRNPSRENLKKLASVLDQRSGKLSALAEELRETAGE